MKEIINKREIELEGFYTVEETARILGVSFQTIYRYLQNNEISGKKTGPRRKWSISGKAIKAKWDEWNR